MVAQRTDLSECFKLNGLSEAEAAEFRRDGYLVFHDALDGARLAALNTFADELYCAYANGWNEGRKWRPWRPAGSAASPVRPEPLGGGSVEFQNVVRHAAVLSLLDDALLLPKVAGVLGWNIFVYLASLVVSPPQPGAGSIAEHVATGWHQDSSRVNDDLEHPRPRLSVKVAFFLSDVTHADGANMWVIPGSHLDAQVPPDAAERGAPLRVPAGTAVLFDRRLWHSASPNRSEVTRKVVFVGYTHRWLRPHDDMDVSSLWPVVSPLRRQLLGYAPSETSRYSPEPDDVPLRHLVGP